RRVECLGRAGHRRGRDVRRNAGVHSLAGARPGPRRPTAGARRRAPARRGHLAPEGRLLVFLAALTLAAALTIAAPSLIVLGVLLALVGLPLNPSLTTISLLVDSHVSASSAAEAFGWLSTGLAGGTGVSSALAGA